MRPVKAGSPYFSFFLGHDSLSRRGMGYCRWEDRRLVASELCSHRSNPLIGTSEPTICDKRTLKSDERFRNGLVLTLGVSWTNTFGKTCSSRIPSIHYPFTPFNHSGSSFLAVNEQRTVHSPSLLKWCGRGHPTDNPQSQIRAVLRHFSLFASINAP